MSLAITFQGMRIWHCRKQSLETNYRAYKSQFKLVILTGREEMNADRSRYNWRLTTDDAAYLGY